MNLVELVVYPGIAFMLAASILLSGILRKFAARMQSRIGPPIVQPFYDILKLLAKDNIKPKNSKAGFALWPAVSLASIVVAGLMMPIAGKTALEAGDVIVIIYFIALSSASLYLAGFSSGNPFGFVGAVRGIMQMVSYEFPFILSVLLPAFFLGTLSLQRLDSIQTVGGVWTISVFPVAGLVFMLSLLATLEIPPFHIPSAHQEIVGGYSVEYTGTGLAYVELAHMVKAFVLITLAIDVFLGGSADLFVFSAKAAGIVFFLAFARVLMARLRIDTALRFYWILGYVLLVDYALRLMI